jgi:RNA polymerase sigma-70 factor (ECF subfamily)
MQHELVQRAQQGDRDAFEVLVRGTIARLYASARLIVRDAELAEDAVQEALIEAWRGIGGLRDPERLEAWLHRLLVRACYRAVRSNRRRQVAEIPLAFDHDVVSPDGLEAIGTRDQLERAFARLPVDHRAVLVLAYYADLSVADVSVALGIPIGTTKSRLNRATSAVRAALDAEERSTVLTAGRTA